MRALCTVLFCTGLFSYHIEEEDEVLEWIRRRNQMLVKTYSLDFVPKVAAEKFMHRRMFSHDLNADLPTAQALSLPDPNEAQ